MSGWEDAPKGWEDAPQAKAGTGAKLLNLAEKALPMLPGGAAVRLGQLLDAAGYKAGEKVSDVATGLGASPEAAAVAGAGTNVAIQAVPMMLGGEIAKPATALSEKFGRRIMQSALKPSPAIPADKVERAITTLLTKGDNPVMGGINASEGGAAIMREKVSSLGKAVDDILAQHAGQPVDKQHVIDAFVDAYAKALKTEGRPQANLKVLTDSLDEFLNHPLANGKPMPVELAQSIKQGIYSKLGDSAYGAKIDPKLGMERKADKTIARGLKEGIEEIAPEVAPVNAEMGDYLNALRMVERRARVEGNSNLVGLGAITPTTERLLGWMLDRSSAAKSLLARYFHNAFDPQTVGQATGAAAGHFYLGAEPKRLQDVQR